MSARRLLFDRVGGAVMKTALIILTVFMVIIAFQGALNGIQ